MSDGHHVWCNYLWKPIEGCPMCKQLEARYPTEGRTPTEMLKTYFPEARLS